MVGGPPLCDEAGMGQVELEAPAVLSTAEVHIGMSARGYFVQTGGVHNAGQLRVGGAWSGHYELQAGELNAADMYLGCLNNSRSDVLQTGGTATVTGDVSFSGNGVYDLRSGELTVLGSAYIGAAGGNQYSIDTNMCLLGGGRAAFGSIMVGQYEDAEKGRLAIISPGAQVEVTDTLAIGPRGQFQAVPGAVIHMTGSAFINESTDPAALAGLGNLTLVFEGGAAEVDPFEVAGEDMGPVLTGFADNFALGTLTLGGADIGKVRLCDTFDNQGDGALGNEALYVTSLEIGAGSYLDLNGLNIYYLNFIDSGGTIDLNGGSMTQVPEPGTLMLIVVGFPMLLKRFRRW